jgi:hypothetical protein
MQAFDHFIADTMAGHDLVYNLARQAQADERSAFIQGVPVPSVPMQPATG